MTAKQDQHGNITITYNGCNGDPLLSPDGKKQLLPCDACNTPHWVKPSVAAFICVPCTAKVDAMLDTILPIDKLDAAKY